jgi:hypothetical protein
MDADVAEVEVDEEPVLVDKSEGADDRAMIIELTPASEVDAAASPAPAAPSPAPPRVATPLPAIDAAAEPDDTYLDDEPEIEVAYGTEEALALQAELGLGEEGFGPPEVTSSSDQLTLDEIRRESTVEGRSGATIEESDLPAPAPPEADLDDLLDGGATSTPPPPGPPPVPKAGAFDDLLLASPPGVDVLADLPSPHPVLVPERKGLAVASPPEVDVLADLPSAPPPSPLPTAARAAPVVAGAGALVAAVTAPAEAQPAGRGADDGLDDIIELGFDDEVAARDDVPTPVPGGAAAPAAAPAAAALPTAAATSAAADAAGVEPLEPTVEVDPASLLAAASAEENAVIDLLPEDAVDTAAPPRAPTPPPAPAGAAAGAPKATEPTGAEPVRPVSIAGPKLAAEIAVADLRGALPARQASTFGALLHQALGVGRKK